MNGNNTQHKQRGIYSEILTTEETEALKFASTIGPNASNVLQSNAKQKQQRAKALRKGDNGNKAPEVESPTKILGKNYFKNNEVNKGYYSKKREGVADIEPKVMEPYVPIPGRAPRKVVIDRQKKKFASLDIEELLRQEGIDYRNPDTTQAAWLPLEPFDDNEFDSRTPDEWIKIGFETDAIFNPVPSKGLYKDKDGRGYWMKALIQKYNPKTEKYEGAWDGSNERCKLSRINLLFDAEDPRVFAKRVAHAHKQRQYADSLLKYNFYIDNMPTTEIPELDAEQVNRILHMSLNTRSLRGKSSNDTAPLLTEVNLDFARTMNKIIFDKHMNEKGNELILGNLTLPPPPPPKQAPQYGMITIPSHDFPEQFSNFCFNTLYIKEEVIKAMGEIKKECNEVLTKDIYNTNLSKTMRLEEFKQIQASSISQTAYYLRETWVNRLKNIVISYFSDVGKGWFNINEKSKETYEFGKLKKFLTLVKFLMQDTLLYLEQKSVKYFVDAILYYIPTQTVVSTASDVRNIFPKRARPQISDAKPVEIDDEEDDDYITRKDPTPLFSIDLVLKPNADKPKYSTKPREVVSAILQIFDNGIKTLQEIPQLEPKVLPPLFKNQAKAMLKAAVRPQDKPIMPGPHEKSVLPDENSWVWDAYEALHDNLVNSVKPLKEYKQVYEKYKHVNKLNPEVYVKGLDEGDNPKSVDDIKNDIYDNLDKEKEIMNEIPENIIVSMFQINCKDVRNLLAGKHSNIVRLEIELIARRARDKNQDLSGKFSEMQKKIKKDPKDIEELTAIKEYMANVPNEIGKEKAEIQACMNVYEILEEFSYKFTEEDLDKKWKLFGAPMETLQIIDQQTTKLEKSKEAFLQQMVGNQEEFAETLNDLENIISSFSQYQNINEYEETAAIVTSVNQRVQDCMESVRTFNRREMLLGRDQTDYSQLNQMVKDFTPYSNLWLTTANWFKKHYSWMNDLWEKLDPIEVENTTDNSAKTMATVLRYFKDKELPNILKIADVVKEKIEEFKPYKPLVLALRKEGMKDRHWKEISDLTKIDVHPTEDFTLTHVLDLGLQNHLEVCQDVGEKAAKQYNIECGLKKMQADWEDVEFKLPQFKKTTTCFVQGFDMAMILLDEHIVITGAMQFSSFKGPFAEEIEEWNKKMLNAMETMEEWKKCQGQWMYLQPIFDSPDIMKQLPAETKRFKSVDSTWRHIINQTKQNPNVLKTCSKEEWLTKFQEANKNLELVQKGLADYLESKRSVFARFYFLSNDDLLEILSQTKEVENVRPHLKKVFENMADLKFEADKTITCMYSSEGEKIDFVKRVDPRDKGVEFWMGDVERMMQGSVRQALLNSVEDYKVKKRTEWILLHPGQCVLNGSQVHWTAEVEEALLTEGSKGITKYHKSLEEQLKDTVIALRLNK